MSLPRIFSTTSVFWSFDFSRSARRLKILSRNKHSIDSPLRYCESSCDTVGSLGIFRQVRCFSQNSNSSVQESEYDQQEKLKVFLRNIKSRHTCYITGQEAADLVVEKLKKDLKKGDVIAEAHPGMGILTKTLLEQTDNKIICYEPDTLLLMELRSKFQRYSNRLQLLGIDFNKFYWYYTMSHNDPYGEDNKLDFLLGPLPVKGDHKISPAKIISFCIERLNFQNYALSFTFQSCIYKDIFPVVYLYVPQDTYRQLLSPSNSLSNRKLILPFIYYFKIEDLGSVPITNFHSYQFNARKFRRQDNHTFHLLKITPTESIYDIVTKEELPHFHYFMRIVNTVRSDVSFISYMEKWIPGCGIDFIKNGFRMFTQPRKMPPEQLVEAFKIFKSLPQYEDSMFHSFCNNWAQQYGLKDVTSYCKEDEEESLRKEMELDEDSDEDSEFSDIKNYRPWPKESNN